MQAFHGYRARERKRGACISILYKIKVVYFLTNSILYQLISFLYFVYFLRKKIRLILN